MNEEIKKMIDESGLSRNKISVLTGVHVNTLNNWYNGHREANISIVKLIHACSKTDEDIVRLVKLISGQ